MHIKCVTKSPMSSVKRDVAVPPGSQSVACAKCLPAPSFDGLHILLVGFDFEKESPVNRSTGVERAPGYRIMAQPYFRNGRSLTRMFPRRMAISNVRLRFVH
jgi:hypothetical protein